MNDSSGETAAFERLLKIVRELRERCPWDREQTLPSLGKYVIEEAYEAADAFAADKPESIADELGDLFAQVLFAGTIAEQQGKFHLAQMIEAAAEKLIRRHPHVYANVEAKTAGDVVANWATIKKQERSATGADSALEGIARSLPALMRAEKLGIRARETGMDWADIHDVLAKVREELDEVEGALARDDADDAASEIGDMLLALANAPRFVGHDAEETLRASCDKFIARFAAMERLTASRGLDLRTLRASEVEALWQEAKNKVRR